MKSRRVAPLVLLALMAVLLWSSNAFACRIIIHPPHPIVPPPQPEPRPRPLRPLETKSHRAEVTIDGQLARVEVEAVFRNPNPQRLEGTYFFPLPADVAVDRFSMFMNGREVKGELLDADRARETYENIVRQIKDPGLLEFVGMQMIKVRVFPIEPNGEVRIRLAYRHLAKKDGGVYSFFYPFSSARPEQDGAIGSVSLRVKLKSGIALKNVYSPTHAMEITRPDDFRAVAGFEAQNVKPERDFLLYWTEAEDAVGASLVTHRREGEDGTFLLMLSPRVKVDKSKVAPKDIVFVLDKSGSMQENGKMEQAVRALRFCVQKLNPRDRFNIVLFSTATQTLFEAVKPATEENVAAALAFCDKAEAMGGTAIDEALDTGLRMLADPEGVPMLLFLTDGLPTVGETNIDAILKQAKKRNAGHARVFVFGVGYDVNTRLLDRLAEDGRGVREYVKPEEDIEVKVGALYIKIASPVLSNIRIFYGGVPVHDVYPHDVPDLFLGGQVTLLGRFADPPQGKEIGPITITGTLGDTEASFRFPVRWESRDEATFLPPLWAMRKVGYLLDQIRLHGTNDELVAEVTRLGKTYGIVTPYTSFLVIEEDKAVPVARRREAEERLKRAEGRAAADYATEPAVGAGAQAKSEANVAMRQRVVMPLSRPATSPALEKDLKEELGDSEALVRRMEIRRIAGKTFLLKNGTWTDSEADDASADSAETVRFMSPEWFALARRHPTLAKILSLGENVLLSWQGNLYRIAAAE